MVALLLKACAAALDAHPRFASSLEGDELVVHAQRHLGFAADTPKGLVVPVIRDVDAKGLLELAGELTELSAKARAGKLSPTEMSGAVFTISSLGGIGGTGFTPIVNPPQVAILGVVRSAMRAGLGRRRVRAAPDPAALAQLRPPRDRRRPGGALLRAPGRRSSATCVACCCSCEDRRDAQAPEPGRPPHHDRRRRPPDLDRLLGGRARDAVRLRAAQPRRPRRRATCTSIRATGG